MSFQHHFSLYGIRFFSHFLSIVFEILKSRQNPVSATKMPNEQRETQASHSWFKTGYYESILRELQESFTEILAEVRKDSGVSQHKDTSVVVKDSKIALKRLCDLTSACILYWIFYLERNYKDESEGKV